MEEYLNKKVKIHRVLQDQRTGRTINLFYTALVKTTSDTHITILDRDGKLKTFLIAEIREIEEINQ